MESLSAGRPTPSVLQSTSFEASGRAPEAAAIRPSEHILTRWLFLRLLGLVYFVAIVSLWTQIDGLIGHNGILPIERLIREVRAIPTIGFWQLPTLTWLDASDQFLHGLCAAGSVLAIAVILNITPAPALVGLWAIYLSLSIAGQQFFSFQWDFLLLEAGFLAIFLAPWRPWPRMATEPAPSLVAIWLVRWLLFRLMFESGLVKLASGDPTWRNLTALTFHYETQPLPTWIGWYAHQLPVWFQKLSAILMFGTELVVPCFVFLGRRWRIAAFLLLVTLQLLIAVTGNYCYFNWLAITLCVMLLDDRCLRRVLPARVNCWLDARRQPPDTKPPTTLEQAKRRLALGLAGFVVLVTGLQIPELFLRRDALPTVFRWPVELVQPFRTFNRYGLFAVMTTERPEIIVEGSNDRVTWLPYDFKYKPVQLHRRPAFVAPHQPRLDWQMWFAALGNYRDRRNRWFVAFLERLLEGSPAVLGLLKSNPFPDAPPRYVRAAVYDYRFTDLASRRATDAWWKREAAAFFCPVMSLGDDRQNGAPP